MQYLGDKSPGATITFWFTTADSDGVPTALTSGAVSVYKDNSNTESTSGVTLTASADGRTGANRVVIDTSADGSFYSAGSDFSVIITAGTVDGTSVVGYVVGRFTLRESAAYDAVAAGVELADGAITAAKIASSAITDAKIASGAITADKIASNAITDAKIASGALTAAKFAAGAFDAVWSVATRVLTAGTNIVLAKGTGITGFNDLDAAGVRSAVGLASANLDAQLGAIDNKVDDILVDTGATIPSTLSTISGKIDTVDGVADAIKAVTDNLPDSGALTSIAQQSDLEAIEAKVDDILEDTGTTLPGELSTIEGKVDVVDGVVDAIKGVTDNLPDGGALSSLATASALATVDGKVDAILEDTGTTLPSTLSGISSAIGGLNDISASDVKSQVVAALSSDTYAEPGQGAPPSTASLAAKIGYLYKAFRNKVEQTATEFRIYNDAGDTVDQKATVGDDGTTFTRSELESGS